MLVNILRLPDRNEIFTALFTGLVITVALSLSEAGYLFYELRNFAKVEALAAETDQSFRLADSPVQ